MKKNLLAAMAAALLTVVGVGCAHSQVPPALNIGIVSWQAPTPGTGSTWGGCTSTNLCTYDISYLVVPAGTTQCPASTGSNYTLLNQTPTSTLTINDTTNGGNTVCYVGQTVQGKAITGPSSPTIPLAIPANPNPPAMGTPTVGSIAKLTAPELKRNHPELAYQPLNMGPGGKLQLTAQLDSR